VDAEQGGGAALVAFAMAQDLGEQRDFHFAQDALIDIIGKMAVQIAQVATDGLCDMFAQGDGR